MSSQDTRYMTMTYLTKYYTRLNFTECKTFQIYVTEIYGLPDKY